MVEFKQNEVIHCETLEEAKEVLRLAHEQGYEWLDGSSLMNS